MFKIAVPLVLAIALIACRPSTEPPATQQSADTAQQLVSGVSQMRAIACNCEDGTYIVAKPDPSTGELVLFLPEQTVWLAPIPSESGLKFSSGDVSFWIQGTHAILDRFDGQWVECVEDPLRSRIEDAKLRGLDFWATGNEPGWTLEMGPETTVLVTDYGEAQYSFRTPKPEQHPDEAQSIFRAFADGHNITITLTAKPCNDSMSGLLYGTTVEIKVGEEILTGCGEPLH